jgi:hypothetical protein
MKKILLTFILAGTAMFLNAQNRVSMPSTGTLSPAALQQNLSNFKTTSVACDTVTNFAITYTPTVYIDQGGGYVSGQNSYGDISKADKFGIPTPNSSIIGALYLIGVATSSGTGQTFNARVWDNDGSGGLPNTVLGTQTVLYDTIVANLATFTTFVDFTPPVAVGDSAYVGVNFGYTAGDTLALFSSVDGEAPVNSAYEQFSTNDWHAFSETPASWGISVAHAIFLFSCTPTGVHEMITPSGNLAIVPNPSSNGVFTIVVPGHDLSKPVTINVYDAKGEVVYRASQTSAANYTYQINLPGVSKGIYMVKVETSKGVQTQKLTIN